MSKIIMLFEPIANNQSVTAADFMTSSCTTVESTPPSSAQEITRHNRPSNYQAKMFVSVLLSLFCLALNPASEALAQDTFPIQLELDLCPEYKDGLTSLEFVYRLGDSTSITDLKPRSLETRNRTSKATAEFLLPRSFGTTLFYIFSRCASNFGSSDWSEPMTVSNCDYLRLLDTDLDGMDNSREDTNCDNFFSPGDASNPDNVDTDGDGVRDLVELVESTDPTNPGSSPRPMVIHSSPFDPDNNGSSNPLVWRPQTGTWYIRDYPKSKKNTAITFGVSGDIPFSYTPKGQPINVGVVRRIGNLYHWYFNGPGYKTNSHFVPSLEFGMFGDNLIPGPWENKGFTSPAVARLFNNHWYFYFYRSSGSIKVATWGGNGDIPKVQDYDGDGIFDIAVYRPAEAKTYVIRSTDKLAAIYEFGSGTADHTVRGDFTGDNLGDIAFWEPLKGLFTVLTSDSGFDSALALTKHPLAYREFKLGTYFQHVPLSWNYQKSLGLFTVVDHKTGIRLYHKANNASVPTSSIQWGLPGDSQG